MLAGFFERQGRGAGVRGEGLFLNSSVMVSGLKANPSRMSNNEIDDVLGVAYANSRLRKSNINNNTDGKRKSQGNSNKYDNNNSSIAGNTDLQFIGENRGPKVEDEYEVNLGQQLPSLSSKIKAFQTRAVDVDESVCARQPAYVWGGSNKNDNNNRNTSDPTRYGGDHSYVTAGSYESDNVDPHFRFSERLDGLSVFPPGESMSSRPLQTWRETKLKERSKEDPYKLI